MFFENIDFAFAPFGAITLYDPENGTLGDSTSTTKCALRTGQERA
jgi:hypothetical protein